MKTLVRLLTDLNVWLIRVTQGRIGGRLAGLSVLLLETVGRKSGKRHVTPLAYFRDGANYILVASNGGSDHDPQWYRNLLAQPRVKIQIGGQTFAVGARTATRQEHPRLWQLVTGESAMYLNYQKRTTRKIPLVILTQSPD